MKEISGEQHHVDIVFLGQAHDFVETFPAVISPNRVSFVVADMIVSGDKDTNGICG